MDAEEELNRLIREQTEDDKYGSRVWPEFNAVSLDRMHDAGLDLNQDGQVQRRNPNFIRNAPKRTGPRMNRRRGNKCKRHDKSERRRAPGGKAYCNGCVRERMREYRKTRAYYGKANGIDQRRMPEYERKARWDHAIERQSKQSSGAQ